MEGETDSLSRIQEESCWSWSPTLLQLCSEQMWLRNLQRKKQATQLARRVTYSLTPAARLRWRKSSRWRTGQSTIRANQGLTEEMKRLTSKLSSGCHWHRSLVGMRLTSALDNYGMFQWAYPNPTSVNVKERTKPTSTASFLQIRFDCQLMLSSHP